MQGSALQAQYVPTVQFEGRTTHAITAATWILAVPAGLVSRTASHPLGSLAPTVPTRTPLQSHKGQQPEQVRPTNRARCLRPQLATGAALHIQKRNAAVQRTCVLTSKSMDGVCPLCTLPANKRAGDPQSPRTTTLACHACSGLQSCMHDSWGCARNSCSLQQRRPQP